MITLKKFSKSYRKKPVVRCDDICFASNRISFIMAPNGCGKTTLLKCVVGLESFSGEICINGETNTEKLTECLVIWDDCPLYSYLTGLNNLLIFCENKVDKVKIRNVARKYIDDDLLKRKVSTYSYGQKKRLALILAELLDPDILIMDEISNGLDFDTMLELKEHLKLLSANRTIILTGHQFAFYENLYDDLYLIRDGILEKFEGEDKKTLEEVYCENLR